MEALLDFSQPFNVKLLDDIHNGISNPKTPNAQVRKHRCACGGWETERLTARPGGVREVVAARDSAR